MMVDMVMDKTGDNLHSIILTIHNQEKIISKVIKSIIKLTAQPYELIVVFDGCNDKSEKKSLKILEKQKKLNYKTLYTPDVFETKANNVGIKSAEGEKIVIVQDDMIIKEKNWNHNLEKPFKNYDDVFSVTAQTAHNFEVKESEEGLEYGEYYMLTFPDAAGWKSNPRLTRDKFYVRQSSNRGPLMLDHGIMKAENYFDEIYAPQTYDEHDLNLRVKNKYGFVSGFYPIEFISDYKWGNTRDENGQLHKWHFDTEIKNMKVFYDRHKNMFDEKIIEDRKIS
jgi:glycosyltransferase involved in cell wall biosynthesis